MKFVKYLCVTVVIATLAVIVLKWPSRITVSQPLSPETLRMIRDKLSESCNRISETNYNQARTLLNDVLRLDPYQPIALYDLAVLDIREGKLTHAHALLVKALKHADQAKLKKVMSMRQFSFAD